MSGKYECNECHTVSSVNCGCFFNYDDNILEKLQEQNKEKDNTIENLRENFAFQKFEFIRLAGELDKKEAQNKILKETLNYIIELDILGNDNQSKMVFVTRETLRKVGGGCGS